METMNEFSKSSYWNIKNGWFCEKDSPCDENISWLYVIHLPKTEKLSLKFKIE